MKLVKYFQNYGARCARWIYSAYTGNRCPTNAISGGSRPPVTIIAPNSQDSKILKDRVEFPSVSFRDDNEIRDSEYKRGNDIREKVNVERHPLKRDWENHESGKPLSTRSLGVRDLAGGGVRENGVG